MYLRLQEKGYDGHNAYSVTKLANLMFSNELALLMKGKAATVNCVHPGVIATKMLHQGWGGDGSDIEVRVYSDLECLIARLQMSSV